MLVPLNPAIVTFPVYDTQNRKVESQTLDFEAIDKIFAVATSLSTMWLGLTLLRDITYCCYWVQSFPPSSPSWIASLTSALTLPSLTVWPEMASLVELGQKYSSMPSQACLR